MQRYIKPLLSAAILFIGGGAQGTGAQNAQPAGVLFENVRIFNGASEQLSEASNVLIVGNSIQRISSEPIATPPATQVTRIDGAGRTLMPGLIDAHTHMMMAETPLGVLMTADPSYLTLIGGRGATATLMRGFTSVRDVGGPVYGLKRAIDAGRFARAAHLALRRDDLADVRSRGFSFPKP